MKLKFHNIRLFIILGIITGLAYPLLMTVLGNLAFPHQAQGSLIYSEGTPIGSTLIVQPTTSPRYFHPRPSAANYATMPSGASNLSWTSAQLQQIVEQRRAAIIQENNLPKDTAIPGDLLFASGSGLDPHISLAAATLQVSRIAHERNISENQINTLIRQNTISGGIFGDTGVNVLLLNLSLDSTATK
ncbi:MAG: potassium-transporting ATPase subunit KdpC [Akkermansia sp.]